MIGPNRERLRAGTNRYRLDDVITAILEHAPHSDGRRYVAAVLIIVQRRGGEAVVEAAQAWVDHLFFPSRFLDIFLSITFANSWD